MIYWSLHVYAIDGDGDIFIVGALPNNDGARRDTNEGRVGSCETMQFGARPRVA